VNTYGFAKDGTSHRSLMEAKAKDMPCDKRESTKTDRSKRKCFFMVMGQGAINTQEMLADRVACVEA